MKRVLCILSNMNAGGAETFLMKIYRSIDRNQYQIDFCVNVQIKNYYEDEIFELGGKVYHIPARSDGISDHDKALYSLIKEVPYEYVLAVSSNATAYLDLRTAKRAGVLLCSIRSSNSNLGMTARIRVRQKLLRILFHRFADVLIAPSDLAAINLFGKHYYEDPRFFYLRNALDYDKFRYSSEKRAIIRSELSIDASELVVGHVGRFYRQKNHTFLLEIFAELVKTVPDARLLLVGEGELEEELREFSKHLELEDRVIFAGFRSDVGEVLSAMDVFVFPSFYEGMPNTVIEAQAASLPCIIADTITREADITGLVEFLPLRDAALWAEHAVMAAKMERRDTRAAFSEQHYDINSATELFTQIVFGESYGDCREEKIE